MSKISATKVAAITCTGVIAGGLAYWISRAKLNYTSPLTWVHGGMSAGLASGVVLMVSKASRSAETPTHTSPTPAHPASLGEFTAPNPQELCDDDILWARSVGVNEPELEQQVRQAVASNRLTDLLVPRLTLLLLAAERAGWEGVDRTRLLAIGHMHRLQTNKSPVIAEPIIAITRSELQRVLRDRSDSSMQAVMRACIRTLVWHFRVNGLDQMDELDEVARELDDISQNFSKERNGSMKARYLLFNTSTFKMQILQKTTSQEEIEFELMHQLCRLRIDALKVVLEERGYVVYVEEDGLDGVHSFRVEIIGSAQHRTWEVTEDQALRVRLIRDILEQHPPIN